jgi:hypothetical protein
MEIKFKVYSKIDKKFLENLHFIDNNWDLGFTEFWWKIIRYENQDNYKILFSTWLKDKNWVRSFEWDIVEFIYNFNTYIWIIWNNKYFHSCIFVWEKEYHIDNMKRWEIIWNIYENPNLITN